MKRTIFNRSGVIVAGIAIGALSLFGTGCSDSSGVAGTKAGSGGFSKEERARIQSGPTEADKKAMQEFMAKKAADHPAANQPVNSAPAAK